MESKSTLLYSGKAKNFDASFQNLETKYYGYKLIDVINDLEKQHGKD